MVRAPWCCSQVSLTLLKGFKGNKIIFFLTLLKENYSSEMDIKWFNIELSRLNNCTVLIESTLDSSF